MFTRPVDSNRRIKSWNYHFINKWQDLNDAAVAADETLEAPERHLLTQSQLYQAEGGNAGLAL